MEWEGEGEGEEAGESILVWHTELLLGVGGQIEAKDGPFDESYMADCTSGGHGLFE